MRLEDPDDWRIDSAIYHRVFTAGGTERYRQKIFSSEGIYTHFFFFICRFLRNIRETCLV